MKAVTRNQYGPPEVIELKEVDKPSPKDNEILVKVHATTVNRTDCGILWGKPFLIRFFTGLPKPSSSIPGTDFAGEVVEIGKGVASFKVGDKVWGLRDEGLASQAQFMTINENKNVVRMPEKFDFDQIVACAEGAHYAYNFINKVKLKAGQKVLVNGATGAIGSASVQMLKDMDLYVTATSNTKNMGLVKSLGPDKVIDWEKEDFTKDKEQYDFVFDAVGKSSFPACKALLKPKGVYISSELGPGAQNLYLPLTTKFSGGKRVIFPIPSNCKRSLQYMNSLIEKGAFKPLIERTYSMDDIAEAYNYAHSGQKTGNLIVHYW